MRIDGILGELGADGRKTRARSVIPDQMAGGPRLPLPVTNEMMMKITAIMSSRLRQEVGEDQKVLSGLLHDLHAHSAAVRNTAAFLSEKLAQIKLLLEDPPAVNWHDLRNSKHLPWVSGQARTLAVTSCRSRNPRVAKGGFGQT
jgi:hypothetical protein